MNEPHEAYKVIIALNNTGCALMHRGMYTDAVDTFKDAIKLTRACFFNAESPSSMPECYPALRAAWNRSCKKKGLRSSCQADSSDVRVINDRDNPHGVYETMQQHDGISHVVNIEPVEYYDGYDHTRIEVESVLLLHNYGIAHMCAARYESFCSATRQTIVSTAFNIFQLAHSVAAKLYASAEEEENISPVLLVSLLVTVDLIQVPSGNEELKQKHKEDLHHLVSEISEYNTFLPQKRALPAAAA